MTGPSRKERTPLPWNRAGVGALVSLAVVLSLALVFNVAIGRQIHWDIVAAVSVAGMLGLTLAFRYAR